MTARGTIGVGYIVKKEDRFYYKDGNLMYLHAKVPTDPRFVLYAFRSRAVKNQLSSLTGATVTHLPIEKANSIVMAFPDLSIQQAVVEGIRKVESETDHLACLCEQKLTAFDELKKSLLHQAFSGQL